MMPDLNNISLKQEPGTTIYILSIKNQRIMFFSGSSEDKKCIAYRINLEEKERNSYMILKTKKVRTQKHIDYVLQNYININKDEVYYQNADDG